jgi:NAD(P)-dependent dehydrogenase (short-subunit alcohol dehydrogenase family)
VLETLGNLGDFLGGLGVITTLVYVSFQIRQNSRLVDQSMMLAQAQALRESNPHEPSMLATAQDAELSKIFRAGLVSYKMSGLAARMPGSIIGSMRNVSVADMTKNLADMLGPDGINVTVVHPGGTRTEWTSEFIKQHAADRNVPESEIEEQLDRSNSIRHFVDAREVARVVAFLCSPKSISINGDAVAVGGGSAMPFTTNCGHAGGPPRKAKWHSVGAS